MASDTLLGRVTDADGDEITVSADADGTVTLEWDHGSAMVLGRAARHQLRELLDRAAMPGQTGAEPQSRHRDDAETSALAAVCAYQKWGEKEHGGKDDLRAARWEQAQGTLNALLAIADHLGRIGDAMREQTRDLTTPLETEVPYR